MASETKQKRLFSEKDSASLFYIEYAQCQMTGKNLWILDTGILNWDSVQIDHVIPWSKGGKTDLTNAALLSGHSNFDASNSKAKNYRFYAGVPTSRYFYENNKISLEKKEHLLKFVRLLPSDFYFNRALEAFLFGLDFRRDNKRVDGRVKERDDKYHAKSVINWLKKWENSKEPNWSTFEERQLLPKNLEIDQKILLKVRDVTTTDDVLKLYDELLPIYNHLFNCHQLFYDENVIYKNFITCVSFPSDIKLSEYVAEQFRPLIDLLSDNKTLPRYKSNVIDTIDFLKELCSNIMEYRLNPSDKINADIFISTYDDIRKHEKQKNERYVQTTTKIECRFPKDAIDLNLGAILNFDDNEKSWHENIKDSDVEFIKNQIGFDNESLYFLTNKNEFEKKHRNLIKQFLKEILAIDAEEI